jgi:hypothetical protein
MSQQGWSAPDAHPVSHCLDVLEDALDEVAGVDPAFMATAAKRAELLRIGRVQARLKELQLRLLVTAGDVAADEGDRNIAAWLDHHARVGRPAARLDARVAEALEQRWRLVRSALREGSVTFTQAEVITQALDKLPGPLDRDTLALAERTLITEAATHGPEELRIMGRRILDVIAPELAEEQERQALEAEERNAQARTFLRGRRRGDGRTKVDGDIPDAAWDRLETYLEPYLSPRRPAGEPWREPDNPDDRRPYEQRFGSAFVSFLEHVDPTRLPIHGGDATTVMVTVDLDSLAGRVGAAGVATIDDVPISAAAVRRLACTAKIIPAVLGGSSEVLDLGRARRLFSRAQRKALRLVHKRCRARGCRVKAAWTEAHHLREPWATGGTTDLADGTLLCCFHHHRAHDPRYDTRVEPDGDITFHRRT